MVNLKRGHKELFDTIDQKISNIYLTDKPLGCFSRIKPSDSRKTLNEVSWDLFELVQKFKGCNEVTAMHSYKQLEHVLTEQCNLTGSDDNPIEMKPPNRSLLILFRTLLILMQPIADIRSKDIKSRSWRHIAKKKKGLATSPMSKWSLPTKPMPIQLSLQLNQQRNVIFPLKNS